MFLILVLFLPENGKNIVKTYAISIISNLFYKNLGFICEKSEMAAIFLLYHALKSFLALEIKLENKTFFFKLIWKNYIMICRIK